MKPRIILGSRSPARQEILRDMGYEFEVMSADIDEKAIRHQNPVDLTMKIARAKAVALLAATVNQATLLITADKVVFMMDRICEKPETPDEAKLFLSALPISPVLFVTSVIVTNLESGFSAHGTDVASVLFRTISQGEIDELIAQGDVMNHAGAVDVSNQIVDRHVRAFIGEVESVRGFPKAMVNRLIPEAMNGGFP